MPRSHVVSARFCSQQAELRRQLRSAFNSQGRLPRSSIAPGTRSNARNLLARFACANFSEHAFEKMQVNELQLTHFISVSDRLATALRGAGKASQQPCSERAIIDDSSCKRGIRVSRVVETATSIKPSSNSMSGHDMSCHSWPGLLVLPSMVRSDAQLN